MQIDYLTKQIQSTRHELIQHPAFGWVNTLDKARDFMETHVWAVWDFMVLLKALQRQLTCVDTYWIPHGDPETRRLINEIVHGEESDVDKEGNATSHFELYVKAMEEVGANTVPILSFITALREGANPFDTLEASDAPEGAKVFVRQTLSVVEGGKAHEIAAVFTFGREDLIPDMFIEIVGNLKAQFPEQLGLFAYYLERHIEVDGDLHGHLAERMVDILCGTDLEKWESAAALSEQALRARINLWTSVIQAFEQRHSAPATA